MFASKNLARRKFGLWVGTSFVIMPYIKTTNIQSLVVGTHTTLFQIQKLCILPTECVCVFHIIPTTK
jgi:hypothetical protein